MFPLTGTPFSLLETSEHFAELGSSFSLYFVLLKGIFFYITVSFIVSLACLIGNSAQSKSNQWVNSNSLTNLTFGNYGNPWNNSNYDKVPLWQPILHMISVIILIIASPFIRNKIRGKAIEFDLLFTTPSDFTIWIKDLPHEFTYEELEEFLAKKTSDPVNIVNFVRTFDIKNYLKVSNELVYWESQLELSKRNPRTLPLFWKKILKFLGFHWPTIEECQIAIFETKKQQESLLKEKLLLTSVAFVSFRDQVQPREISQQWNISSFFKLLVKLKLLSNDSTVFKNQIITASLAPEPSDVYWENLSANYMSKIFRRIITYSVALLTIFITFIVLFSIRA